MSSAVPFKANAVITTAARAHAVLILRPVIMIRLFLGACWFSRSFDKGNQRCFLALTRWACMLACFSCSDKIYFSRGMFSIPIGILPLGALRPLSLSFLSSACSC